MTYYYPNLPQFQWKNDFFYIGLTGAIGSGKSSAAKSFQNAGAILFDADQIAKSVLNSAKTKPGLISIFGDEIFDSTGSLDHSRIAAEVFTNDSRLQQLNELIHPEVRNCIANALESAESGQIYVYDIPLLFETSQQNQFDCTIVISATLELRQKRVQQRNQWSLEQFQQRESSQMPLVEKEKKADLVIKNNSDKYALEEAINTVYKKIHCQRM